MAKSKDETETGKALVPAKNAAATLALLDLGEEIFLTDEQEEQVRKEYFSRAFIRPHELDGVKAGSTLFLCFKSREEKPINGKNVGFITCSPGAKPDHHKQVMFIESASMVNQFTPERRGKRFAMLHAGIKESAGKNPCQLWSFAWER